MSTHLDKKTLEAITIKVARRFPEVAEKKPVVKKQANPTGQALNATNNFLLLYKTQAAGPQGRSIPRIVRVVVSPDGKIIKMTTSR